MDVSGVASAASALIAAGACVFAWRSDRRTEKSLALAEKSDRRAADTLALAERVEQRESSALLSVHRVKPHDDLRGWEVTLGNAGAFDARHCAIELIDNDGMSGAALVGETPENGPHIPAHTSLPLDVELEPAAHPVYPLTIYMTWADATDMPDKRAPRTRRPSTTPIDKPS
jgi:hypothetical protein